MKDRRRYYKTTTPMIEVEIEVKTTPIPQKVEPNAVFVWNKNKNIKLTVIRQQSHRWYCKYSTGEAKVYTEGHILGHYTRIK